MPFNGSGTFDRSPGGADTWQDDRNATIKIKADLHDNHDQDIAGGLSQCITKDGQTQPTGNLPLAGKRWVNCGDPVDPQDYATKHWVETLPGWTTAKNISGADEEGRLNFNSPTGVNGITWTGADLAWLAKQADPSLNKTSHRLVLNDAASGEGADVLIIDDGGRINSNGAMLTWNLSWDGDEWRTIVPGFATRIGFASGNLLLGALDEATTLDEYKPAPLRDYFKVENTAGTILMSLFKSANKKMVSILSGLADKRRWWMQLGDDTDETGTANAGSNFVLKTYDDDGTTEHDAMKIARGTRAVDFYGNVTVAGSITSSQQFNSNATTCIISAKAGGTIYFRPNGPSSTVEQMILDVNGGLSLSGVGGVKAGAGLQEKAGQAGSYGSQFINFLFGSGLHAYVSNVDLGAISFTCDYRIKQKVRPIQSTWDKVKALRPVSYEFTDFAPFEADGIERWGFIAHDLQAALIESAASGHKDEENVIQSPDLMAVVAALTSTLQEAQLRIEALEARAA